MFPGYAFSILLPPWVGGGGVAGLGENSVMERGGLLGWGGGKNFGKHTPEIHMFRPG